MTILKPFMVILKSLLFYIFDSFALYNETSPQKNKFELVLLVRQDAIGDFIMWLDTAKEFRQLFPAKKYKIILIGNASWCGLADEFPYWDQVLPINSKKFKSFSGYRWGLLRTIKNMRVHVLFISIWNLGVEAHHLLIVRVTPRLKNAYLYA